MNIVICDDEDSTCAELEKLVLSYGAERKVKLQTEVFYGGDSLMNYLRQKEKPDILFLDIEIPVYDGLMIGDYIRKESGNDQTFIIYISSKEQYAMQLFRNRPFDFLVKPVKRNQLFDVLDSIYKILNQSNESFVYQNNGSVYRVLYRDILYFQSEGRKIHIITGQQKKTFYGKISEVEKKVPGYLFLNVHKSYLINFNYVEEYAYERVKMLNGDIINISRTNRAEVRKKIMEREMYGD